MFYDMDDEEMYGERKVSQAICDSDCRGANNCHGRVACNRCGAAVCECETDEHGYCDDCAEHLHCCENCAEDFFDDENGFEREGYWFCCEDCATEFFKNDETDTTSDTEGGL